MKIIRLPIRSHHAAAAALLAAPCVQGQLLDFGDAPASYLTLSTDNGARHLRGPFPVLLGAQRDFEPDGIPSPGADGDDLNALDDGDGVTFLDPLIPGRVSLTWNSPNSMLQHAPEPQGPWTIDTEADGTELLLDQGNRLVFGARHDLEEVRTNHVGQNLYELIHQREPGEEPDPTPPAGQPVTPDGFKARVTALLQSTGENQRPAVFMPGMDISKPFRVPNPQPAALPPDANP